VKLLVTGGAGFIGNNFIRYILERFPDVFIVNYDALTYAGNLENLIDIESSFSDRYAFIKGDICDKETVAEILSKHEIEAVINFAAETHVDRSILDSDVFIRTNVIGTKTLLDASLKTGISLFIQISTDEVYGSLGPDGLFTEEHQIAPNSPYSASKAAADHIVRAYYSTYNLPAIITRCSNNYGPYQFPEKLIPLLIHNALAQKALPIYGDGKNVRDWIHVDDHSSAISLILRRGTPGEVYNIGGKCEMQNIRIAETILELVDKPRSLITFVKDRPGHDKRYAMDFSKLQQELGWEPDIPFDSGLKDTVDWYKRNAEWVRRIMTKEYMEYYDKNYSNR